MGMSWEEKGKLVTYQLKRVAQVWYTQWKSRRVDKGLIGWGVFKATFLDCFFTLKLREANMIE